ncbi:histidine utilization repressor [Neorhizobium lilium]|uniref:Histidine utilization repressor n=1 Tax=Neorhizobium lilium TaxID=2503024 RepID=A0A3S3S2C5_9HYPH|nr:histidine utilization repressor [Neorhizobium lilium]RWX75002.1 histidine utilization repressor [Neorhizobium lilium]
MADTTADTAPVLSLHQRILGDVEQNILSGRWPPGHKVPSEQLLAEQYGCSRMTVNKVLTQLARAGLVQRRRKTGSVVLPQKAQSAILEIYDIREEVKALDRPYSHDILQRSLRPADKAERERLDLSQRQKIVSVTCLHFAGEMPFCLEERLINLAVVPEAEAEEFHDLPPGPWLLGHVPWSAAEHRIAALGANEVAAQHLQLGAGTPVLVVERQTWRLDQSVTHVRLTYPGESHALMARFTPMQA